MRLVAKFLALGTGLLAAAAHASCNCGQPHVPRCSESTIASAESKYLDALRDASALAQMRAFVPKPQGGPQLDLSPSQAKAVFDKARQTFGDKALAAALGTKASTLPAPDFARPEFNQKLVTASDLLHSGGAKFLLYARPDMTMPGTPAPGPIPDGMPVRILQADGQSCWAPLDDPMKPAAGGMQLAGAFGLNFPEVGRIVRVSTEKGVADLSSGCAFVLLAPRWAVTALHCVADQAADGRWIKARFKDDAKGVWRGERGLFLGQSASLSELPGQCFGLKGPACPWTLLRVEQVHAPGFDSDAKSVKLPKSDIALVRLQQPVGTVHAFPGFAEPPAQEQAGTLVAFGTVDPPFWAFFDLQVGWNFAVRRSADGKTLRWNPSETTNQSSACRGDSGGAVFEGYENGGCRCKDGKEIARKRKLAGLISYVYLRGPEGQPVPGLLQDCRGSTEAGAVIPAAYKRWICDTAPDLAACR